MKVYIALLLYSFFLSINLSWGQDGTLDTTFGTNGVSFEDFFDFPDYANAAGQQSNGKIVVAGRIQEDFGLVHDALVRYLDDGTLDPSFGNNGKIYIGTDFPYLALRFVHIDSEDSIILAGRTSIPGNDDNDFLLSKFSSDGVLDTTFGINGFAITDIFGDDDTLTDFLVLDDGKFLTLGRSKSGVKRYVTLARHHSDGTLDSSFGTDGTIFYSFTNANYFGQLEMALQNNGKIILTLEVEDSSSSAESAILVRLNPNGQIDDSYGSNGIVELNFTADSIKPLIAIDDSLRAYVILRLHDQDTDIYEAYITRYLSNGTLDASFGTNGIVDFGSTDFSPSKIILQQNGRFIVTGCYPGFEACDFGARRFYANGNLDIFYEDVSFGFSNRGSYLLNDGKLLAVGTQHWFNGDEDFVLVRYHNDPLNLEDFPLQEVILSPNPSAGLFTIQFESELAQALYYQIADVTGKMVQDGFITEPNNSIDLRHTQSGMYFLNIENSTFKIIKE